jgi:hypothetical protein
MVRLQKHAIAAVRFAQCVYGLFVIKRFVFVFVEGVVAGAFVGADRRSLVCCW